MHFKQLIGLFVITALLFSSCETTDCISFSSNAFIIQFFDKESGQPENIDVQLIEAEESNIILYSDTVLSIFYLPINTGRESTTFYFRDTLNNMDTLKVSYQKSEILISEDCGFELSFTGLKVTNSTFDSTVVSVNQLSRLNEENIQIYR